MTVPTAGRWDVRDKYAIVTGVQKIMKIRGRRITSLLEHGM